MPSKSLTMRFALQWKNYLRKYWICGVAFSIFFYMRWCLPNYGDRWAADMLYTDHGGIVNYLFAYIFRWYDATGNTRFLEMTLSGILESTKWLSDIMGALLFAVSIGLMVRIFFSGKSKYFSYPLLIFALFLWPCAGIFNEVYYYAAFLFLTPVVLILLFILSIRPYFNDSYPFLCKSPVPLYIIVFFSSFWVESLSLAMFGLQLCCLIYIFVKKMQNKKVFIINAIISGFGAFFLSIPRFLNTSSEKGLLSLFDFEKLLQTILSICINIFEKNSSLMALLCLFFFATIFICKPLSRKWIILKWIYVFVILSYGFVFLLCSFNRYAFAINSTNFGHNVGISSIPTFFSETTLYLPVLYTPGFPALPLLWYGIFVLLFIPPILVSRHRLALSGCFLIAIMSTIFIAPSLTIYLQTEQNIYRITSIILFMAILIGGGLASDLLEKCDKKCVKNALVSVACLLLAFLPAEKWLISSNEIYKIRLLNEDLVREASIQQISGKWDFEKDVLYLVSYGKHLQELPWLQLDSQDFRINYMLRNNNLNPVTTIEYREPVWQDPFEL